MYTVSWNEGELQVMHDIDSWPCFMMVLLFSPIIT